MADKRAGPTVDPLAVALRLLRADAPAQIMGAPQDWPRWAVLLPHVLAATGHADHASRQPGPAVMADAVVAAGPGRNLPASAGAAHRRQGAAGTRAGHRRGGLRPGPPRRRRPPEQPGPDPAGPGAAGARPGRCKNARWPSTEAAYGPDHPDVATDLNNLALILQDLGQPEEARPLQERALAIDRGGLRPGPPRRRHAT